LAVFFSFSTLWYFSSDLPDYKILSNYKPPVSSRVHSGEGQLIAEYALQKRLFIPYEAIPKKVITHLKHGLNTMAIRPSRLRIKNKIIATNQDCLNAMILKSKHLGFATKVYSPIRHDVVISAKKIVQMIPRKKNSCMIFGGEPTVQVKGKGKGGRNQELVLQILKLIHNSNDRLLVSSISTDGIDGNTTCSGALIENNQPNLQKISSYLKNNDSHSFFKKYDGLIKTGPTHTNLMDIGLIIKY